MAPVDPGAGPAGAAPDGIRDERPSDRLLADLRATLRGGLALGGHLLSAGELAACRAMLGLSGEPALLHARLFARRGDRVRLDTLSAPDVTDPRRAAGELAAQGLLHGGLPPRLRLGVLSAAEMRARCASAGLPRGGPRAVLLERLLAAGVPGPPVLRLAHRGLVRRLERMAFHHPWRDRRALLLERIGRLAWPDWPLTGGEAPFPDRRALLAWEQPLEDEDHRALLERIERLGPRPPWWAAFDPRRRAEQRLGERLLELERSGEVEAALCGALRWWVAGPGRPEEVALRIARLARRAGRPEAGLRVLEEALAGATPDRAIELDRAGRRLSRAAGRVWRPLPPLRAARVRRVRLPGPVDRSGARPRYGCPPSAVEDAVVRLLAPRRAIHGENALWTTLFALLAWRLMRLPVPGMFPVRRLDGPLDLGTPAFAANRAGPLSELLGALERGEGPRLLREALPARELRIAGLRPGVAAPGELLDIAGALPGRALAAVVGRLAREGWSAARGLPDLVVLPGPELRLPGAFPARVAPGLLLVEVKGPGDRLSPAQRAWLDVLLRAGASAEVWRASPAGGDQARCGAGPDQA